MKRTAKQNGKYARRKGHQFERDMANELKCVFPEARRHLENHKEDAAKGIDLMNCEPFGIQLKCYKDYVPINRINEVTEGIPVLITKGDRLEPMVVMSLKNWMKLLKGELL